MKKVGSIRVGGVPFALYLANEGTHAPLKSLEGETDVDATRIVIREGLSKDKFLEVLTHELVHAVLWQSGLTNVLQGATKKKGKAWDEFEEILVRLVTPHLLDVARQVKALRVKP